MRGRMGSMGWWSLSSIWIRGCWLSSSLRMRRKGGFPLQGGNNTVSIPWEYEGKGFQFSLRRENESIKEQHFLEDLINVAWDFPWLEYFSHELRGENGKTLVERGDRTFNLQDCLRGFCYLIVEVLCNKWVMLGIKKIEKCKNMPATINEEWYKSEWYE